MSSLAQPTQPEVGPSLSQKYAIKKKATVITLAKVIQLS